MVSVVVTGHDAVNLPHWLLDITTTPESIPLYKYYQVTFHLLLRPRDYREQMLKRLLVQHQYLVQRVTGLTLNTACCW